MDEALLSYAESEPAKALEPSPQLGELIAAQQLSMTYRGSVPPPREEDDEDISDEKFLESLDKINQRFAKVFKRLAE